MTRSRLRVGRSAWRVVSLMLMSVAGSGLFAAEQHGAAAAKAPAQSVAPLYTEEELLFLSHMILHHEQALELAALVPSRTKHEDFIRFARYVDGGQRAEIDQMKGLLSLAADRGIAIPHHEMSGAPPMAGMLSKAQMTAITAASGAEFERLWLQGMIYHHEGAMDMGRVLQQREYETGRQPYGLDTLVDDILVVQRGEITKMKAWLVQWGLTRSAH